MKHNFIRYSMIILLIGLSALAAGQAYAQDHVKHIQILSLSWGVAARQTTRVSVAHLGDGAVRMPTPVIARIKLLDMEGEVIARSDEIRVEPGKIRFWDAPRDQLLAGEPTGRIQVRAIIEVSSTKPFDFDRNRPPLALTVEIIDSDTGRTVSSFSYNPFITVDFP